MQEMELIVRVKYDDTKDHNNKIKSVIESVKSGELQRELKKDSDYITKVTATCRKF